MLILLAWIAIWLATLVVRGVGLSTAMTLLVGLMGAGIAGVTMSLLSGPHLLVAHLWELGGLMFAAALVFGLTRWQGKWRLFAHA